jgi:hypothetical protein
MNDPGPVRLTKSDGRLPDQAEREAEWELAEALEQLLDVFAAVLGSVPVSKTCTMCGVSMEPAALASRWKRVTISVFPAIWAWITLSANRWPVPVCSAS